VQRIGSTVLGATTVRLLGPISLDRSDGPVPIGGPRAQRMMAALALRANRPVAVPFLVEAVWGAQPPRTSRDQVHNGVVRLRRILSEYGDEARLTRVGDGYRLDIEPERVDAYAFQGDLARARSLSAAGDVAGAAETIRAALRRWYGTALDGVADGALAGEAARLDELRLSAYEDLFAHELALGQGHAVVGEIAALASRHPLRERLVQLWMGALRRSGRSAEALRVYRDHRRRMIDELGVEPDRSLRVMELEILSEDMPAAAVPRIPPRIDDADPADLAVMLLELAALAVRVADRVRPSAG
jgi:DNA-binding SARP family transcriptional activator